MIVFLYNDDSGEVIMATLKEMREKMFLTQEELATKLGVATSSIAHWEQGFKEPRPKMKRKLAVFFKIDPVSIEFPKKESK